ncbi:CDP-alcohol phosphatidyltransferase family protein [Spirillospora sp. CA-294931]|uniref:CDP-alcohol phosphatidyltransferase family protein n=1 Tax=Spirillospora sp. CA-294931 TaxID=3240042 RepID=UPI003D8EA448
MATFSLDEVCAVRKPKDAWWTVLLVDPVAVPLTRVLANRTAITPDQITVAAFLLGIGAAGCFAQGSALWLVAGAVLYHVAFVLDCCDGKIARLKGNGSPFGGWLDFMLDRVRDICCAAALAGGQYAVTGEAAYLWLGFAILALDMLRYLNGPKLARAGGQMREAIALAQGPRHAKAPGKPSRYVRVRDRLMAHRIRPHLFSGIEFQMAVFIVGPLTGLIIPVAAVAGALLLLFELVLVYRFWRLARAYGRVPESVRKAVSQDPVPHPRPTLVDLR